MKESRLIQYEELRRKITPEMVGYILGLSPRRLGALAFMTFLEYRHFLPQTPANDELIIAVIDWEGMRWALVAIPQSKDHLALAILKELGLRKADGIPHIGSHKGWSSFPIDLPNLFTVENVAGHFVYRNDPKLEKTAEQFEDEAVTREREKWEQSRRAA